MKREDSGAMSFEAYVNDESFKNSIREMENRIRGLGSTTEVEANRMNSLLSNIAIGAAGAFTFNGMLDLRQKLIDVRGEMERYEAVLANTFGSQEEAADSLKMLTTLAGEIPAKYNELTESFVKLVNQGFKPTRDEILKISDLASYTSKGFEQLTEAILDAQIGQFERLNEFGIKASKSGNEVIFTFRGVSTEVENSSEAIKQYLLSLGDMKGVKGASQSIMKGLEGQVTSLESSITSMLNNIAKSSEGFLSGSITATKYLVDNYEAIGKALITLVATYGSYKAVLIAVAAYQRAAASFEMINGAIKAAQAINALNVSMGALNATTRTSILLQGLLKAVSPAGWVGIAVAGVVGLATALSLYSKRSTEAEKITKQHEEIHKKYVDTLDEERAKIDSLLATLKNDNIARQTRLEALEKLKSASNGYLNSLTLENLKTSEGAGLLKEYNDQLERNIWIEATREERIAQTKTIRTAQNRKLEIEKEIADYNSKLDKAQNGWVSGAMKGKIDLLTTEWTDLTNQQIGATRQIAKLNEEERRYTQSSLSGLSNVGKGYKTIGDQIKEVTDRISELQKKRNDLPLTDTASIKDIDNQIKALKAQKKQLEGDQDISNDKQTTEKILENKKREYEKYFAWKEAFGKDSADKEYASLISQGSSYWEYLKQQILKLESQKEALSKSELKRLSDLKNAFSELGRAFKEPEKIAPLSSGASYDQALEALNKYLSDRKAKVIQSKKSELNIEQHSYTELIQMGKKELQAFMENIKSKIRGLKLTADEYNKLIKLYNDAADAMKAIDTVQGLKDASEIMRSLGDLTSNFNDELGKTVKSAAELAGNLATAFEGFATKNPVQSIVGIIGAISSIAEIASNLTDDTAEQEKLRQAQLEQSNKMIQAMNDLLSQQIGLIDAAYGIDKIEAFKKAIKQAADDQAYYNKKLNGLDLQKAGPNSEHPGSGSVSGDMLNRYLGFNGGDMVKALEQLKYDIQTGIVNGTEQNEELALNYIEQLQSSEEQMAELQKQYVEYTTGTTTNDLIDKITEMFEQGKTSAADFADTFENLMSKALLQAFKIKMLEGPLTAWFEEYSKGISMGAYNTSYFLIGMQQKLEQIGEDAQAFWDELEKNFPGIMAQITGISTTGADTSLTGAVKGVTEETASLIAGQMNAIRINQAEMVEQTKAAMMHLANIDRNTLDTVKVLKSIKSDTKKLSGGSSSGSASSSTGTLI